MPPLWLALLLCLWCSPADASAGAPARVPADVGRIGAQAPEYPNALARSDGGLELLQSLDPRRSRQPAASAHPLPSDGIARLSRRCSLCPAGEPVVPACSAHCERHLYYATAPPAGR